MITGRVLIDAGFPQGPELGKALDTVRALGLEGDALRTWVAENKPAPRLKLQDPIEFVQNIRAESDLEAENVEKVIETMRELVKTPTIREAAVMPDACPAGPVGTIPVGGVVAAEGAIHPGMHSADICCSVMVTRFTDADPKAILDAIHKVTHFGPGGRKNGQRFTLSPKLYDAFRDNSFLNDAKILQAAQEHMGTQGDGNHFAYVGRLESSGETCLVTHHGSRGPGAGLYKLGMRVAEKFRTRLSEGVLKANAWIPFDTDEGRAYWDALQIIRKWTKANHNCLHQAAADIASAQVSERFWNEHNFVFRDNDIFWHAKGATPIRHDFLPDTNGTQIVPLNMAEPVLLIQATENDRNLGFAPHGAGRNYSRSAHRRALGEYSEADIMAQEAAGLDARFYSGNIDVTELPSAYKSAQNVQSQMSEFELVQVVDRILPYGCIMAGDWERDMPWRNKAKGGGKATSV